MCHIKLLVLRNVAMGRQCRWHNQKPISFMSFSTLLKLSQLTNRRCDTPHSYQRLQACERGFRSPSIFYLHAVNKWWSRTHKSKLSVSMAFTCHMMLPVASTFSKLYAQHITAASATFQYTLFWNLFPSTQSVRVVFEQTFQARQFVMQT